MGTRMSGGGGEEMSADEDSDTEEYKDSVPDVDLVTAGTVCSYHGNSV